MAGLQVIKSKAGSISAYRLTIKTPGSPLVNLQLPASIYTRREAESCRSIAEEIETAYKRGEELSKRTTDALSLYPDYKRRIVDKGLIDIIDELTLAELWSRYLSDMGRSWSLSTADYKARTRDRFFTVYNPTDKLSALTRTEAQRLKDYLDGLTDRGIIARSTASGILRDVKAVFNWAVKNEIIDRSPFQYIARPILNNDDRKEYIELDRVRVLLSYIPSLELRSLVWTVRRVGLRCQSETNALKWTDIDLVSDTITIISSKTAKSGKGRRLAPLFPDVKELLLQLKQEQERDGLSGGLVFPSYRSNSSARLALYRIIKKNSLDSWEKILQNLRLSASVDILRTFGADSEALWVGHSPNVRALYYRGITPATLSAAKSWRG